MKSLAQLQEIRKKALDNVNLRKEREDGIRVVVGMATCGIASGARPVMTAFLEEVSKRHLETVTVAQTGCIGICRFEPVVEIYEPGKEKVTYVKMNPEKARQVVAEHLVNGKVVSEFTIGSNLE